MAGNVKVGGNVIATHTGVEGGGTVTLSNVTASGIKMSSSGNTITDSAGNAVISESGGAVTLSNLSNISGNVTAANLNITGSGYKPAEVWLSTTTINSATTYIDLPSGYSSYSLRGTDLFFNESGSTQGEIRLYFEYGSYTTDTAIASVTRYMRIESANANDNRHTGFAMLAQNMAGESSDNLNFIGWIHNPTTSGRTRAYSYDFLSVYGHDGSAHSYSYRTAGRSETTNVITRLKITMTTVSGSVVAPYGGKVILTGMTG